MDGFNGTVDIILVVGVWTMIVKSGAGDKCLEMWDKLGKIVRMVTLIADRNSAKLYCIGHMIREKYSVYQ